MSDAIQFLASLGSGSPLTPVEYASSVSSLDIDEAQKTALLVGDETRLNQLLDGRAKLFFCRLRARRAGRACS